MKTEALVIQWRKKDAKESDWHDEKKLEKFSVEKALDELDYYNNEEKNCLVHRLIKRTIKEMELKRKIK